MGKLSRTKGANYERSLSKLFKEKMHGADIRRGLQFRGASKDVVADVENPIFWIECKRGIKPSVRGALKQAIADSDKTGKIPLAVIRDDKQPAFCVLLLDDFLEFVGEWWEMRSK
jgi:hypothetical protein